MPVRGPGLFKAIQRLTNNEVVDPSTPEKNSEAKRWPSFRKPTQAGGSATTQVQHSAVAKSSSARVTESVLRAELLALEEAWAMERDQVSPGGREARVKALPRNSRTFASSEV